LAKTAISTAATFASLTASTARQSDRAHSISVPHGSRYGVITRKSTAISGATGATIGSGTARATVAASPTDSVKSFKTIATGATGTAGPRIAKNITRGI
jgi:hypothetical protein